MKEMNWPEAIAALGLREVEAKREIVQEYEYWTDHVQNVTRMQPDALGRFEEVSMTMRRLASVYSGHPDYRDEWELE